MPELKSNIVKEKLVTVPLLVWALSRDTYDFTLWATVRDIAEETGECCVVNKALAELAMMSHNKLRTTRRYLIEVGLLRGELRRDVNYSQPMWHLTIPDLQPYNTVLGQILVTVEDKIEYKRQQAERDFWELLPPEAMPPRQELESKAVFEYMHGYIYLLHGNGFYKIGQSVNVDDRINSFAPKLPFPTNLILAVESSDRYREEKFLHDKFAAKRVHGEWFKLTQDDVDWIKNWGRPL